MEENRKDILICGVNGFTAQKLLEYIVDQRPNLTVGVTCRSENKLNLTFKEISAKCKKSLSRVESHIIGVENIGKLAKIFEGYKVVINCIGPFANTGLSVVEACIRAKTHYVDCTGEPGFMEESFQLFQEKAKNENVMIVHACGFDSLPLDIGINYTMKEIEKKGGAAESAESYMQLINSRINLGTFKTIITSLDTLKNRKKEQKRGEQSRKTESKKEKKDAESSRGRKVKKMPFFCSDIGMYAAIFPGSDAYVLRKTRQALGRGYPVCHCYIAIPSIFGMVFLVMLCLLIGVVYMLPEVLRRVAYDCIDFLSLGKVRSEGPSDQEIACSGFQTRIFTKGKDAEGKPAVFKTLVSGPDPGYITTPITLLISAETILSSVSGLLKDKGGVHTPGSLFVDTNIIQRLTQENIMFCTITNNVKTS
ncbi:hypothetical protein NEMIN01_1839 [Nematocida minor]|uniref:uncharacterized protein n=1 Tax=Nematocida minor TaxID=1912983 RepID=UPI002220AE6D|nr:uncharacterized protein NEMIN01_1839 [Nematocida minor]KAI5192146.1 hypothetical protein NEMIN01_1839 [Nematocida minor]